MKTKLDIKNFIPAPEFLKQKGISRQRLHQRIKSGDIQKKGGKLYRYPPSWKPLIDYYYHPETGDLYIHKKHLTPQTESA